MGALLRDAEQRVAKDYGYALDAKAKRRRDLEGGSEAVGSGSADG